MAGWNEKPTLGQVSVCDKMVSSILYISHLLQIRSLMWGHTWNNRGLHIDFTFTGTHLKYITSISIKINIALIKETQVTIFHTGQ